MNKEKQAREIPLPNPELVRNVLALKQEFNDILMSSSSFKTALAHAYLSVDIVEASPMRHRNITFPLKGCEITVSNMILVEDRNWTFRISKRTLFESQLKSTWDPLGFEFGLENIFLDFQERGNYPNYSHTGEFAYGRKSLNGIKGEGCKNSQLALKKIREFAQSLKQEIKINNKSQKPIA